MANSKPKAPKITTPKGTFKFPRLNEPDTKFKADGEYSVKLILDGEQAEKLIKKLQPYYDEAVKAGEAAYKKLPVKTRKQNDFKTVPFYHPVYDDDTEEETGDYEFTFKMKASGENKKTGKRWTMKPVVFDAKGVPLKKVPNVWGGTVGKVSFSIPYMQDDNEAPGFFTVGVGAGLSLRLEAVQIIELVSGGGSRNAKDYGFGEEDGFSADDVTDEDDEEDEDEDDTDGSEDEDLDDEVPF